MAIIELDSMFVEPAVPHNNQTHVRENSNVHSNLKIQPINFPSFDGRPEKFRRFIDSLESILNKFNLTSFEKYSYLLQQVSGPARKIVESVSDDSMTYEAAKALLESAFSDKTVQQFSVIKGISSLKLFSSDDFFTWISEVRQLSNQVDRLNITNNVFMQYFIWENMSDVFKKQFISVTNCARPSVDDIIYNAFEVEKRMKTMSSMPEHGKYSSVTLATKVDRTKFSDNETNSKSNNPKAKASCQLCNSLSNGSNSNHKIYHCEWFPTPQSKLDKLKELGGCTRCGSLGHKVNNCNYRFTGRCRNCTIFHAFFLCVKDRKPVSNNKSSSNDNGPKKQTDSDKMQTSSCVTEIAVLQSHCPKSDVLLPTLTASLRKSNHKGNKDVRVLYDTASQSTFVSEKLLNKVKHKILKKNITAKISGFNTTKKMCTKVVELECMLGPQSVKLSAVVVPDIEVNNTADNLDKIKNEFSRSRIDLADSHLNESQHIDILLGADQAHLLPIQACRFGKANQPSLVYYCNAGIMLLGNASHLVDNLAHLNLVENFIEKFSTTF